MPHGVGLLMYGKYKVVTPVTAKSIFLPGLISRSSAFKRVIFIVIKSSRLTPTRFDGSSRVRSPLNDRSLSPRPASELAAEGIRLSHKKLPTKVGSSDCIHRILFLPVFLNIRTVICCFCGPVFHKAAAYDTHAFRKLFARRAGFKALLVKSFRSLFGRVYRFYCLLQGLEIFVPVHVS